LELRNQLADGKIYLEVHNWQIRGANKVRSWQVDAQEELDASAEFVALDILNRTQNNGSGRGTGAVMIGNFRDAFCKEKFKPLNST